MSQPTRPALEPNLTPHPIDAGVRIGHAHLKVADLDRALAFYCGVLGFELKQRYGHDAAFLAAGGYHQLGSIVPVPFGIKVSVNFCWSTMCMVQGRPSATAAADATTDALG